MADSVRRCLFSFVFLVLSLPFAEHCLRFITSGALKGGFQNAADIQFSVEKWVDGSYQKQKELYLNDHTGFRPDIVRLNNQLDFSLFGKCHAGWTVLGKQHFLYQWPYMRAYYGQDFVGFEAVRKKAIQLKAIQDTLGRLGKSLILVYAPSKATFYPEYLPDEKGEVGGATNYRAYRYVCDSLGINQVDAESWFLSMKGKTHDSLFSRQGIHYTVYGTLLLGDSLVKFIEKLRHVQMPHYFWTQMEHTTVARFGDDDVASELNLIFPVATERLSYPILKYVTDSPRKKLNAIYIGDSFAFKMLGVGQFGRINNQCEYWGYFKEVNYLNDDHYWSFMKDYDWVKALNKADYIVLQYTSFNLAELGNGFIEDAYGHYYPGKK